MDLVKHLFFEGLALVAVECPRRDEVPSDLLRLTFIDDIHLRLEMLWWSPNLLLRQLICALVNIRLVVINITAVVVILILVNQSVFLLLVTVHII